MTTLDLRITLLTDAVFSSNATTVGAPASLEFVPGAALLGAAAARLYERLGADAWTAFHSGAVRFGPGMPVGPGLQPTVPVPLSWHVPKRGPGVFDRSHMGRRSQESPKRDGFVAWDNGSRRFVETRPLHRGTLRTAIGPDGRAHDGLLYGFDAIAEGTVFHSRIHFDQAARHLKDPIAEALTRGTIRLGRSRGAELGLARVEVVPRADEPVLTEVAKAYGSVALFLVTDLCLRDGGTGAPVLVPTAEHFGLPSGWTLALERTFTAARTWSPFNGTRLEHDLERQALRAGSVLVFRGTGPLDRTALAERLARGVGEYRQDGLGRVVADPFLLSSDAVDVQEAERPVPTGADAPTGPVLTWIEGRAGARKAALQGFELTQTWANELADYGLPGSQWQLVREQVALFGAPQTYRSEQLGKLVEHLFGRDGSEPQVGEARGLLKQGIRGGEDRWGRRRRGQTAAEALRTRIVGAQDLGAAVVAMALDQLATAIDARVKRDRAENRPGGRR